MMPEIITGGSSILGTALGAVSSAIQNRQQRKYEGKVYDKQRADALADWSRQNEYNHPSSQMSRLREAGLNPNLVYGSGAAQAPAQSVRSTDQKVSTRQPLGLEKLGEVGQNLVQTHFNTQTAQAQIDNLRAQNTIMVNKAALQGLEAAQLSAKTAYTHGQIETNKRLADASIRKIEANILESETNVKYKLDENQRRAALTGQSLKESVSRILTMESARQTDAKRRAHIDAQIRDIDSNIELKKFEAQLNKLGMTKTDELWQRILGKMVNGISDGMTLTELLKEIGKGMADALNPF